MFPLFRRVNTKYSPMSSWLIGTPLIWTAGCQNWQQLSLPLLPLELQPCSQLLFIWWSLLVLNSISTSFHLFSYRNLCHHWCRNYDLLCIKERLESQERGILIDLTGQNDPQFHNGFGFISACPRDDISEVHNLLLPVNFLFQCLVYKGYITLVLCQNAQSSHEALKIQVGSVFIAGSC